MGAFEDGQSFLAGVFAKIPEHLRTQVQEALGKPEAKDAVVLIGDSVLARSDYSKAMDKLKTTEAEMKAKTQEAADLYERNQTWYTANKAALDEYPELKKKAGGGGGGNDDPPTPNSLGKDEIQALVDNALTERERGYVDVAAFMQDVGFRHYTMFGERLEMRELTSNPKLGKPIAGQPGRVYGLQDAYNEKYGERVQTKVKEAEDKRVNDLVEAKLAEERKKLVNQPFPLRGTPQPSVLDVLETKDGSAAHTIDTAVALYDTLQAGRGV